MIYFQITGVSIVEQELTLFTQKNLLTNKNGDCGKAPARTPTTLNPREASRAL